MKEKWFFGFLAVILAGLVFIKPSLSWNIQSYFTKTEGDSGEDLAKEIDSLKAENALLKGSGLASKGAQNRIEAFVFSRYPFNFKHELIVSAGEKQGVVPGAAILVPSAESSGILLGYVESVYENSSLARTIFDIRWSSAVRIGSSGTEALLGGGLEPMIGIIPKNAAITSGDAVYNADPKFPYGLAVGEVGDLQMGSDQTFRKANLKLAYDLGHIQAVYIINNVESQQDKN